MPTSRLQIWLTVLAGIFLVSTVLIFAVFALAPTTALVYRPTLLTGFIVALFISLVCIAWLLRGLLRPELPQRQGWVQGSGRAHAHVGPPLTSHLRVAGRTSGFSGHAFTVGGIRLRARAGVGPLS